MKGFFINLFLFIYKTVYYFLFVHPFIILKSIKDVFKYFWGYRIGNIKCPNCQQWGKKGVPIEQTYLGKKIIQEWKTDVHYLNRGYELPKKYDRIKHKYKVDKEVNLFRNTYRCSKCNNIFKLDEY